MGLQVFKDNAGSTLASSITNSVTSLTVATGEGSRFPSPTNGRYAYLTIDTGTNRELVKYTSRSGDVISGITRGQGITSAVAHSAGVAVQHRPCAEMLTDLQALVFANIGWFGSGRDGDVTITTTVSLSRDMYYRNLTISGSGILKTNGWRVHVREKLDLSGAGAAAIQNIFTTSAGNGNTFFGGGNGQGAAAGTFSSSGVGGTGTGGESGANNADGTQASAASPFNPGNGGSTAKGGAGGDAGSGGKVGGSQPPTTANTPWFVDFITEDICIKKTSGGTSFAQINAAAGGCGGSSGAGDAGPNYGGGGGGGAGGGGFLWVAAKIIDFGSNVLTGILSVAGGPGGAGANGGGGTAGGGGGGAGGGGGVAYVIVGQVLGSGAAAVDLSGGAGGAGGNGVSTGKGGGGGGSSGSGTGFVFSLAEATTTFTAPIAPVDGDPQQSGATGSAGKTNPSFADVS